MYLSYMESQNNHLFEKRGWYLTLDNSKRVQGEEASCIGLSECLEQLRRGSISLLVDLLHACRPSGTGDSRELSVTVRHASWKHYWTFQNTTVEQYTKMHFALKTEYHQWCLSILKHRQWNGGQNSSHNWASTVATRPTSLKLSSLNV